MVYTIPCVAHRGPTTDADAEKGLLREVGPSGARLRVGRPVSDAEELTLSFTLAGVHYDGVRARASSPRKEEGGWGCRVDFQADWPERIRESLAAPKYQSVLLLEDDAELRRSLEETLSAAGYDVAAAGGVQEAVRRFEERGCDLAVVDLGLPDGSGLELVQRIRAHPRRYATPVVILTSDARLESKLTGLAIGADHYLVKPVDPVELLFWLAALLRRTQFRAEGKGVIAFERGEIDPNAHVVLLGGREFGKLSRKEFDLLYRLIAARPRVLSKRYILSVLWHTVVTDNTVEVHVKRLREKLGPEGASRIVTVPGKGYKFV